ncbi:hypothetical protein [Streptomyces xantholiticus]|uniref:hypothetical protein n=1 Tax=Streptomyces xantholiticus TaxID=68285 RepID=UPI00167A9933|nr:hypothetical protein [Streptomyces xantholiticus]GGW49483.1 hypothetical protein GCM10010381_38540 [Streptomyces xantholiticus]
MGDAIRITEVTITPATFRDPALLNAVVCTSCTRGRLEHRLHGRRLNPDNDGRQLTRSGVPNLLAVRHQKLRDVTGSCWTAGPLSTGPSMSCGHA